VIVQKLNVGDYGCRFEDGYEVPVYFERKSLTDLFGTLGDGYARFKKEIIRAKESEKRLIVIVEKCLLSVDRGCERSFRSGNAILTQLFTLRARYGLETVFCTNRVECAEYIVHYYSAIGREYVNRIKEEEKCQRTGTETK
jgi:ERCC4-type nuclease